MGIPLYPKFKPLEAEDYAAFNEAFRINPPLISEFTFTNLFAWRKTYNFETAILGKFLIVRSKLKENERFLSPIGNNGNKAAIEKILYDTGGIFIRMPEAEVKVFEKDARFLATLDQDNSDYLYNTQDLIKLSGKKYDGKRNLIKNFKSAYKYEYIDISSANIAECLDFEEAWCVIKKCDEISGLNNERQAIREMVDNFSRFGLIAGIIKVENKISALVIAQTLNPETLVIHVLKADPNITGLYQVIFHEFLLRRAQGYKYVNMEQDLGIAGLRRSKLSYCPARMINKYSLSFTHDK